MGRSLYVVFEIQHKQYLLLENILVELCKPHMQWKETFDVIILYTNIYFASLEFVKKACV